MPRKSPVLDYSQIRNYAEQFCWIDPVTGLTCTGFNPPQNAVDKRRRPFTITWLTEEGIPYRGRAVCIGVNTRQRSRRLQMVEEAHAVIRGNREKGKGKNNSSLHTPDSSMFKTIARGEIRQVSDILIIEIDGVRFSAS